MAAGFNSWGASNFYHEQNPIPHLSPAEELERGRKTLQCGQGRLTTQLLQRRISRQL